MKQEGEGRLRGSEHHLNPVNIQKADNNTEDETILKTQKYMQGILLRSCSTVALFSGNLG